jgi:hypothetical protein
MFLLFPKVCSLAKTAQQSVHLTLGILRQSQAVFYALSFFQLDGFAVPAPAQVTQTVGRIKVDKVERENGGIGHESKRTSTITQ